MTRERYQYLVRMIEEAETKGEISESVAIFATSNLYYDYQESLLKASGKEIDAMAFGGSK
jgi:hypothetical protein